jgi:hypothetical protein
MEDLIIQLIADYEKEIVKLEHTLNSKKGSFKDPSKEKDLYTMVLTKIGCYKANLINLKRIIKLSKK